MNQKDNIRHFFLTKRKLLDSNTIENASKQIQKQFLSKWKFKKKNISCFLPIEKNKEVNTFFLLEELEKNNFLWVPVSDFTSGSMEHYSYNKNTALTANKIGILEPIHQNSSINASALDVVIIPLLAADIEGNRIGYGKGFYDRMLKMCSKKTLRIGLSFFEPCEEIPSTNFDEKIHFLVTPEKTFEF